MKVLVFAAMILGGGLLGFGWAKLVGCPTGGCPLTATPWRGTLFGMVMGGLMAMSSMTSKPAASSAPKLPGEEAIVHIESNEQFRALIAPGTGKTVLVDFYADWCGPCRHFGEILAEFAPKHKDAITVVKVNVDKLTDLDREYKIEVIPTVILFRDGKMEKQSVGGMDLEALEAWVAP